MADGVPITAGSGTTILTDDTGAGGHAQVIKLAISQDGVGDLITATTNGLSVIPRIVAAYGDLLAFSSTEDLDETEEEVKGSAGAVAGYYFYNASTSARVLKFYDNTAGGTTVGSTATNFKFKLPPSAAGHIAFPYWLQFSNGITVACTTGYADSDTTAPTANDVSVVVFYV